MTSTSEATKRTTTFGLVYWLLCLDGHAIVLALVLELLVWPLVEQNPGVERFLSASPDSPYERCWSTFGGVWPSMKAPKCYLLLGSPSRKRGSRGLAFDCLPTSRTPRCQWLLQSYTHCYFRPRIPAPSQALVELCWPLAPSWWCPTLAVTRGIHRGSSTL